MKKLLFAVLLALGAMAAAASVMHAAPPAHADPGCEGSGCY